jgi:hypothetical protein
MSFFESIPERLPPPPEGSGRPAWLRPDGVIPGSAPAGLLLVRTDEVAVAVGNARAYPNGFQFAVHVRLRQEEFLWGAGPFDWLADLRTRRAPEQALRLGVLCADGGHLVLLQDGGAGSERQWDGYIWVHPLPPDGPVTFVASWLLYGVPETRAELDGSAIREAAARAVILWPDGPDNEPRGG